MSNNILQYESKIWSTADLMIGAGIKQSDFPKYMIPFINPKYYSKAYKKRALGILKFGFSAHNVKSTINRISYGHKITR